LRAGLDDAVSGPARSAPT